MKITRGTLSLSQQGLSDGQIFDNFVRHSFDYYHQCIDKYIFQIDKSN